MRRTLLGLIIAFITLAGCTEEAPPPASEPRPGGGIPEGFRSLFDGKTISGWHISKETHHGKTQYWVVEDGAIVGTQDKPGHGGLLLTNQQYGNFELYLELMPDFGCDSGIFLRSNEKGQAYQILNDYLPEGNVGGIYGEGIGGFLFPAKDFPKVWKKDQWNSLRVRIEGNPPHIMTWMNGEPLMDWTDTQKRLPDEGMIGLQVHGGTDRWAPGRFTRYRHIAVKELGKGENQE